MPHTHDVYDVDTYFVINPDTRNISNGSGNRLSLMQYDHNSEEITFELPRFIEGHDMLQCDSIRVHYTNVGSGTSASTRASNSDIYVINNIRHKSDEEDNTLICSWLISQNATKLAGTIKFLLQFVCTDNPGSPVPSYIWHTNTCSLIDVLPGMNNADAVVDIESDAFYTLDAKISDVRAEFTKNTEWDLVITDINDLTYDYIVSHSSRLGAKIYVAVEFPELDSDGNFYALSLEVPGEVGLIDFGGCTYGRVINITIQGQPDVTNEGYTHYRSRIRNLRLDTGVTTYGSVVIQYMESVEHCGWAVGHGNSETDIKAYVKECNNVSYCGVSYLYGCTNVSNCNLFDKPHNVEENGDIESDATVYECHNLSNIVCSGRDTVTFDSCSFLANIKRSGETNIVYLGCTDVTGNTCDGYENGGLNDITAYAIYAGTEVKTEYTIPKDDYGVFLITCGEGAALSFQKQSPWGSKPITDVTFPEGGASASHFLVVKYKRANIDSATEASKPLDQLRVSDHVYCYCMDNLRTMMMSHINASDLASDIIIKNPSGNTITPVILRLAMEPKIYGGT